MSKQKKSLKDQFSKKPHSGFSLPERAQRLIWGIVCVSLALIFVFAFFERAGVAGRFLFQTSQHLFGRGVFLLPFFLTIAGFLFFGMKGSRKRTVFLALFLVIGGMNGVLGTFALAQNLDTREFAGFIGYFLSFPVFRAFGFWVAEIIFATLFFIAGVIFWQLLPHEKISTFSLDQTAQETIKKIFEPKFQVEQVEPELKVQTVLSGDELAKSEKKESVFSPAKVRPLGSRFSLAGDYAFPPPQLLEPSRGVPSAGDIRLASAIIKKTLQNFDIALEISEVNIGPTVTQYAIKPAEGVKLSRITALSNDLALALAAHPIRMEAPIPGRALVGIEVPNKARSVVRLRELIEHQSFQGSSSPLLVGFGRDVTGNALFADLAKMPHLLVAGATGTGKTICLNNIILSLIYRNSPENLRFILVDPKRVEFPIYNELPHLLTQVILDIQKTVAMLKWLIKEMERRFEILAQAKSRDISSYHTFLLEQQKKNDSSFSSNMKEESMPYIVLVIDELADLMAARGKELEGLIVRLAQMARAVGIHLVLATQRPSVEVITGLIKANITSRIAFQVASQVDSRTILDIAGAEKLLGQGDLLFLSSEFSKPKRIQGAYVSEKDVKKVVHWIEKENADLMGDHVSEDALNQSASEIVETSYETGVDEEDSLYEEAKRVVLEARKASASLLQRRLKIGYARAARLLDILENRGVVGPGEGAKPREVYGISKEQGGETSDWFSP